MENCEQENFVFDIGTFENELEDEDDDDESPSHRIRRPNSVGRMSVRGR